MRSQIQSQMVLARTCLIGLGALWMIVLLTACGAATPLGGPSTPNAPTALASPAPSDQTSAGAATPTEVATKVAFAVSPTLEVTVRTATPGAPATPKPTTPTGRFAYTVVTGREPKFFTVWVANANGSSPHQILTHAQWPALSPDGKQVAYFGRPEGKAEGLYLANSDGGAIIGPLVVSPGVCCLSWSRDGAWVVYATSGKPSQPGGPISTIRVDGSFKTIVSVGVDGNGPSFSPDGKQIVYSGCLPNTNTCGLILVSANGGPLRQLTTDNGGNADFSPRGDKIIYQATDSADHRQVFIIDADGSGKKQLTHGTSNDGQPAWSRDGGSIFWRSDQNGTAWAVYVMNADGTNPHKLIDNATPNQDLWGWESLSTSP